MDDERNATESKDDSLEDAPCSIRMVDAADKKKLKRVEESGEKMPLEQIAELEEQLFDSATRLEGKELTLNLYDRARHVQKLINAPDGVEIDLNKLMPLLECPICFDLLKDTMSSKTCMHRYCEECINIAMMRANRECPGCRGKLGSRRNLSRDENYDRVVETLFPERSDVEIFRDVQAQQRKSKTQSDHSCFALEANMVDLMKKRQQLEKKFDEEPMEEILLDDEIAVRSGTVSRETTPVDGDDHFEQYVPDSGTTEESGQGSSSSLQPQTAVQDEKTGESSRTSAESDEHSSAYNSEPISRERSVESQESGKSIHLTDEQRELLNLEEDECEETLIEEAKKQALAENEAVVETEDTDDNAMQEDKMDTDVQGDSSVQNEADKDDESDSEDETEEVIVIRDMIRQSTGESTIAKQDNVFSDQFEIDVLEAEYQEEYTGDDQYLDGFRLYQSRPPAEAFPTSMSVNNLMKNLERRGPRSGSDTPVVISIDDPEGEANQTSSTPAHVGESTSEKDIGNVEITEVLVRPERSTSRSGRVIRPVVPFDEREPLSKPPSRPCSRAPVIKTMTSSTSHPKGCTSTADTSTEIMSSSPKPSAEAAGLRKSSRTSKSISPHEELTEGTIETNQKHRGNKIAITPPANIVLENPDIVFLEERKSQTPSLHRAPLDEKIDDDEEEGDQEETIEDDCSSGTPSVVYISSPDVLDDDEHNCDRVSDTVASDDDDDIVIAPHDVELMEMRVGEFFEEEAMEALHQDEENVDEDEPKEDEHDENDEDEVAEVVGDSSAIDYEPVELEDSAHGEGETSTAFLGQSSSEVFTTKKEGEGCSREATPLDVETETGDDGSQGDEDDDGSESESDMEALMQKIDENEEFIVTEDVLLGDLPADETISAEARELIVLFQPWKLAEHLAATTSVDKVLKEGCNVVQEKSSIVPTVIEELEKESSCQLKKENSLHNSWTAVRKSEKEKYEHWKANHKPVLDPTARLIEDVRIRVCGNSSLATFPEGQSIFKDLEMLDITSEPIPAYFAIPEKNVVNPENAGEGSSSAPVPRPLPPINLDYKNVDFIIPKNLQDKYLNEVVQRAAAEALKKKNILEAKKRTPKLTLLADKKTPTAVTKTPSTAEKVKEKLEKQQTTPSTPKSASTSIPNLGPYQNVQMSIVQPPMPLHKIQNIRSESEITAVPNPQPSTPAPGAHVQHQRQQNIPQAMTPVPPVLQPPIPLNPNLPAPGTPSLPPHMLASMSNPFRGYGFAQSPSMMHPQMQLFPQIPMMSAQMPGALPTLQHQQPPNMMHTQPMPPPYPPRFSSFNNPAYVEMMQRQQEEFMKNYESLVQGRQFMGGVPPLFNPPGIPTMRMPMPSPQTPAPSRRMPDGQGTSSSTAQKRPQMVPENVSDAKKGRREDVPSSSTSHFMAPQMPQQTQEPSDRRLQEVAFIQKLRQEQAWQIQQIHMEQQQRQQKLQQQQQQLQQQQQQQSQHPIFFHAPPMTPFPTPFPPFMAPQNINAANMPSKQMEQPGREQVVNVQYPTQQPTPRPNTVVTGQPVASREGARKETKPVIENLQETGVRPIVDAKKSASGSERVETQGSGSGAKSARNSPRPPNLHFPVKERMHSWLNDNASPPVVVEDSNEKDPERRAEEVEGEVDGTSSSGNEMVEIELLATNALLKRKGRPEYFAEPFYMQVPAGTQFISLDRFVKAQIEGRYPNRPKSEDLGVLAYYWVLTRESESCHIKRMYLRETIGQAQQICWRGSHLIVFYDFVDIQPTGAASLLGEVVNPWVLDRNNWKI